MVLPILAITAGICVLKYSGLGDDEPAVLITTMILIPNGTILSLYVPIYDDTSVLIDTDEYNVVPVDITPFNGYKELYDIPYFNGINSSSPPFQLSDVGAKGVLAISNHVLPDHPSKIKINPPNWHKGTSVYGGVVLHQDSSGKFEYVLLTNSTANLGTYIYSNLVHNALLRKRVGAGKPNARITISVQKRPETSEYNQMIEKVKTLCFL